MNTENIKLMKKVIITGKIKTVTGLHIGGSNSTIQIGGLDNAVVRNPIDNKPYIPGSSLKGKMRSLLEQSKGTFGRGIGSGGFGPTDDPNNPIARLFGKSTGEGDNIPSKIIVRDCELDDFDEKMFANTDLPYTEVKTEVTIDRIIAKSTPRQVERVPAGVTFKMNIVVNVFSFDIEKEMLELVFNGLRLIQDDYLGGYGSRGSGQVKFNINKIIERKAEFYTENNPDAESEYTEVQIPDDLNCKES